MRGGARDLEKRTHDGPAGALGLNVRRRLILHPLEASDRLSFSLEIAALCLFEMAWGRLRKDKGRYMSAQVQTITLACGMPLIVEQIEGVGSVAMSWMVSGGVAREPENMLGLSAMWSELLFRGAGDLDSRGHSDALERFGVLRSSSAHTFFLNIGATLLGAKLEQAMPLIVDMVRAPRMEEDSIPPVRDLCLQAIEGLKDEPQDMLMHALRRHSAPPPLNRSSLGTEDGLGAITRDDLVKEWRRLGDPKQSIFAIAGAVEAGRVAAQLNELLEGWEGACPDVSWRAEDATLGYHHEIDETNQVHIAIAHEAPKADAKDAWLERVVISALSGGMSGRLFTEVREKRSLCYSVNASYRPDRDFGKVVAYAGTTPERAQETLDVLWGELGRINGPASSGGGVSESEFQRAVVGLKSRVVMNGESSAARAGALARDLWTLGRTRSLEELAAEIDAITLDAVNDYLERRKLEQVTIVTVGPAPLAPPAF